MTTEEAIKIIGAWAEVRYQPTRDAARLALAALRAQLERENPQPDGGTPEDLVQVVRCARCQWWWKARKAGFCNHPKCDTMRVTRPDFYCAAGETAEMEETT